LCCCFLLLGGGRHTCFTRDWISDVCSPDLVEQDRVGTRGVGEPAPPIQKVQTLLTVAGDVQRVLDLVVFERLTGDEFVTRIVLRSEERRVGKSVARGEGRVTC